MLHMSGRPLPPRPSFRPPQPPEEYDLDGLASAKRSSVESERSSECDDVGDGIDQSEREEEDGDEEVEEEDEEEDVGGSVTSPSICIDAKTLNSSTSNLDDMLSRVKALREERKQILGDMNRIKSALTAQVPTGTNDDADPSKIVCFICGLDLVKLNSGSIMHMGLQDGDPICPKALHLTEDTRKRIRDIADTKNLTVEKKYELLRLSGLSFEVDETASGDAVIDASNFLSEIEQRRSRATNERILSSVPKAVNENVAASDDQAQRRRLTEERRKRLESRIQARMDREAAERAAKTEADQRAVTNDDVTKLPSPSQGHPKLDARLQAEICRPVAEHQRRLSHVSCDDRSSPSNAGKVLRFDLSPTLSLASVRKLLREIPDKPRTTLRHVAFTHDRSAPFIPKDMEVFCVGDAAADKKEKFQSGRERYFVSGKEKMI